MQNDRIVVSGGLVLAWGETGARPADIVLEGDTIAAIVPPGTAEAARPIDATGRLIIPGLVNAHTHGHGGLAKGVGDRWSLELLLNAGPWINGGRTGDDRYLSTLLSAVEMMRKGCTACYDLSAMLPVPSVEALHDAARAYADVGMRAVIAPMIADRTFYQAIPGLSGRVPAGTAAGRRGDAVCVGRNDPGADPARPRGPGPTRPTGSAWASRRRSRCIVRMNSCAAAAIWRPNSACRCRRIWRNRRCSAPVR